jgi:lipopolysaccharide biosynthesis protein
MRILALYLPQYHEVPENNEWWGEGFTEWTNVRGATPLYEGHRQPLHPLHGNYYDLTDPDVLTWQSQLAHSYGIGGFVFFHYWYSGRRLLEKPVDLWRETQSAQLDYCLCWANHPWTRAWDGKQHQVLQPQTYGGRRDWDAHLRCLLPFFHDRRYISREGRPLLLLYNASTIPQVDEMVSYWSSQLRHEGFAGLDIVEYISSRNRHPSCSHSIAVYEDEPLYSLRFEVSPLDKLKRILAKRTGRLDIQDYDKIWQRILRKRRTYDGREIIQGAFVAWDNSPRRGSKGSLIVRNADPKRLELYLQQLLQGQRKDASSDFIIMNSWNEWGEGAMLEPTEEHGYGYLEAVRSALRQTPPEAVKRSTDDASPPVS